jgi:predicted SnoaL-like aldol condensation-catalyzing enzyme
MEEKPTSSYDFVSGSKKNKIVEHWDVNETHITKRTWKNNN